MRFLNKPLLNYSQRLRQLRYLALGFLLCLLIPLTSLLYFGYQQLEENALASYQREADAFVISVNRKLFTKLTLSNNLPNNAFAYYQQIYNPLTKQLQQSISPLSDLDVEQLAVQRYIRGLVGYFQYDNKGQFNSPVWPFSWSKENNNYIAQGENDSELIAREKLAVKVYEILSESSTIENQLRWGIKKEDGLFKVIFDIPKYFIFYRIVSNGQQNKLQGYIVERQAYLQYAFIGLLEKRRFTSPVLVKLQNINSPNQADYFLYESSSDGIIEVKPKLPIDGNWQQQLISRSRLSSPFGDYWVFVSTDKIPMTASMLFSKLFILVLIVVILAACYGFYRLGVSQLMLAEQRLNFVSSVSHELKTPLTSIRMYSEMLKQGTIISKQHRQDYYEFIYNESGRLTRLINNILLLSSLSNQQQNIKLERTELALLQDIIRSKTSSIIEKHGFQQNFLMELPCAENLTVLVDQDAFSQVIINITDNAIKFFDKTQIKDVCRQKIDFIFRFHPSHKQWIQLEIRDYGEGITTDQASKIFGLFYRGGDELKRTTQGTGIGLALVDELMIAQQGKVEIARKDPGLAMLLSFQYKPALEADETSI